MERVLICVMGLFLLGVPSVSWRSSASAQGTGPSGRYYTKADVERIIKRVEERSDSFRKVVDQSLDRSTIDGTNQEVSLVLFRESHEITPTRGALRLSSLDFL